MSEPPVCLPSVPPRKTRLRGRRVLVHACLLALSVMAVTLIPSCSTPAEEPSFVMVIHLSGGPYERGVQHGKAAADRIRSVYAGLLTNSILPFLNRERPDLADVLSRYKEDRYTTGQFSYYLMLESAQHMEQYIPAEYIEEMHGIADGAGVSYEQILIMNTFLDTMLGFRAMTFFIRKLQAPNIVRVTFDGGLESDGLDNDDDGEVDEPGEATYEPYDPNPRAIMTEVPPDAKIKIVLRDSALMAIPEGASPDTLRIQLDKDRYIAPDPSIATREFVEDGVLMLEVTFTPPGGMKEASVVSLLLQAQDKAEITEPPPIHARVMRDERFSFSTRGYGKVPHEIENRGEDDGRTQPASVSFAVRGSATPDGQPLLAHHYALLDTNTSHKHTALFVIRPNNGIPHVVVGWTGLVGGFSGMNAEGLALAVNNSDTLDNSMAAAVQRDSFTAQLVLSGVPIFAMTREILSRFKTVSEGVEYLRTTQKTVGWNILLQDATGDMTAVEMDADSFGDADHGFYTYTPDESIPDNLDAYGRRWSSVGPDDLRMASHYIRNAEDVHAVVIVYEILPQRTWTTFYFRSVRTHSILGEEMGLRYGQIDARGAIEILRRPDIIDKRDSMNAAVYRPGERKMYYAMGTVPATDAPFKEVDLAAEFGTGGQP